MAYSVLYLPVSGLPQCDSHALGPFSGPPSSGNLNNNSCPESCCVASRAAFFVSAARTMLGKWILYRFITSNQS